MSISPFLTYLQHEKRYSPHTLKSYEADLLAFEKFLSGEFELSWVEVEATHVRSYIMAMLSAKIAEASVGRRLSALRSFYKYLVREQIIAKNPMVLVKAPKVPKKLPVFVEEGKMNRLLDGYLEEDGTAIDYFDETFESQRDKLVLELLFGTGIRLAELLQLRESDINFYEGTIKVLGKRNKERIIPVHAALIQQFKDYLVLKSLQKPDNKTPALIVTNKGATAYEKLIYRIVNRYLGFISTQDKKSPHVLRHSFASSLLNRGADLNDIKLLLGHASLAATQVYTHNGVERLKSIYKQAHPKA
ncbi:MAG: tyrosine-type recombinase/integrase [Pedobacter sp.]|nr:tyrosine-type recombinase/integrase [Pedobacter sp.]